MKFLCVSALVCVAIVAVAGQDKYTSKYDGIDLDEILQSERLFNNYFKCIMDQGNCTPDGRELRTNLPEALKTDCAKCTEKQKHGTAKIIRFLREKKDKEWNELIAKYDPENTYVKRLDELEKSGY